MIVWKAPLPGWLAAYVMAEYVSVSVLCPETGPDPGRAMPVPMVVCTNPTCSHRHHCAREHVTTRSVVSWQWSRTLVCVKHWHWWEGSDCHPSDGDRSGAEHEVSVTVWPMGVSWSVWPYEQSLTLGCGAVREAGFKARPMDVSAPDITAAVQWIVTQYMEQWLNHIPEKQHLCRYVQCSYLQL